MLCERCHENAPVTGDEWCHDCITEVELLLSEEEERQPIWADLAPSGTYTFEDLERKVAEYEDEYGLDSDVLLELHRADRAPVDLSSFDRHVWLSFYRELLDAQRR